VSDKSPGDLDILELVDADLTSESTVGPVEDVLSRDGNVGVRELAGEVQVEERRGNDNLRGGVELGGVEVVDDGLDGLGSTVPDYIEDRLLVIYSVVAVKTKRSC
jgi:hypothetical protein